MERPRDEEEAAKELFDRLARSEFHRWAGLELTRVAPGEVEVVLALEPHHFNLVGIVHGGMIAALADTATGVSLRTVLGADSRHVTTQLSVQFIAPGTGDRLIGRGRVVKVGRLAGFAEADVLDARERLIARAGATFAIMPVRDRGPGADGERSG